MLFGLLAFGGVAFWILIGFVFLLNFYFIEAEKTFWATVTLVGTFAALALLGDFNLWHVVRENPMEALYSGIGYFLLGAGWSLGKWWFHVKDMYRQYSEARAEFMVVNGKTAADQMDQTMKDKWKLNYSAQHYAKPKVRQNKSRITLWMMYWPWSAVWTVINDPVRKIFAAIFHELQGLYQKIADSVYKNAERDV
jgi:hypothetical protein